MNSECWIYHLLPAEGNVQTETHITSHPTTTLACNKHGRLLSVQLFMNTSAHGLHFISGFWTVWNVLCKTHPVSEVTSGLLEQNGCHLRLPTPDPFEFHMVTVSLLILLSRVWHESRWDKTQHLDAHFVRPSREPLHHPSSLHWSTAVGGQAFHNCFSGIWKPNWIKPNLSCETRCIFLEPRATKWNK